MAYVAEVNQRPELFASLGDAAQAHLLGAVGDDAPRGGYPVTPGMVDWLADLGFIYRCTGRLRPKVYYSLRRRRLMSA